MRGRFWAPAAALLALSREAAARRRARTKKREKDL